MRQQRPPPVVERKRRRFANDSIRVWRDTDPKPQPSADRMTGEIEAWVNRLRMANDPAVVREAGAAVAHRDAAETEMASVISMPHHPLGPGYFVVAKKGRFGTLGRSLRSLFSKVVFPSATTPDRPPTSLGPFVKAMRKGEDWP